MAYLPADYTHTPSSSALPAIRTVYASVARTLQTSHLEEMESYDREKEAYRIIIIHSAGNSTHHKKRLGKASLQYWFDATPA